MHKTSDIQEAVSYIQQLTDVKPTIGIILGSGLGPFADTMENAVRISYDHIPHFAQSAAVGHDVSGLPASLSNKDKRIALIREPLALLNSLLFDHPMDYVTTSAK